jgi:phenylacetate-CoA ligase
VLGTSVTATFWLAFTLRDHLWHRRDFAGKLASLRDSGDPQARAPHGMREAYWGPATASTFSSGPAVKLTSRSLIGEQVEWLLGEQPDYLVTYPSNLVALARRLRAMGRRLDKLKDVTTVGERVDDRVREACQAGLGVPIKDLYTAQEVGYMALQCPDHEHYHVQSENVYLEIVREDGTACAEDEIGKVLVTSLHNFATPLIRYDIGDFARRGRGCACGRGLPVIADLLGRVRNMLTLPSGEQRWPHFGSVHFDEVAGIEQFQLVQKSLERIEMRLSAPVPPTARQEAALRSILQTHLGHPFEISFVHMAEIPRGAGGKFEDFLSELPVAEESARSLPR